MRELTLMQELVLDFIKKSAAINGYPPTMQEICDSFGWKSINAADTHIKALVRKGALLKAPTKSRGIRVA